MRKVVIFLVLILPSIAYTQTTELNSVFSVAIENIGLLDVVKGPSGYYGAKKGTKFLVIEGVIYSSVSKRVNLQLHKIFVKTETDSFMGLANPSYIPYSKLDRFIRLKKKAKKSIYFEVDENFSEGILIYNQIKIGTIKVLENGVSAELIPVLKE